MLAARASELMGMFFVVLGVLASLSVYVSVVGPVGRGLDTSLRWTVGLGRSVLPLVCLGLGVALLKRVSIEHRVRLTFGWLVVSVALLGVMHVFLAANEMELSLGALEVFIHNTPTRTDQTQTKREGRTPRTRHSRFILMLATCNVYRAHRHGSESLFTASPLKSDIQWFNSAPKTPDRRTYRCGYH
jgi:hypothetical protein